MIGPMHIPQKAVFRRNFPFRLLRPPIFYLSLFIFSFFPWALLHGLSEFFWEDPEIFSESS
ncbi:MAG: hypothetical protein LBP42_08340, partial [Treponema sp.]|nr:hypothetical protein [Treponema sp.]